MVVTFSVYCNNYILNYFHLFLFAFLAMCYGKITIIYIYIYIAHIIFLLSSIDFELTQLKVVWGLLELLLWIFANSVGYQYTCEKKDEPWKISSGSCQVEPPEKRHLVNAIKDPHFMKVYSCCQRTLSVKSFPDSYNLWNGIFPNVHFL